MAKVSKINGKIGIDISKDSFAVSYIDKEGKQHHLKCDNNMVGIKNFVSRLDTDSHCLMDVSGSYHTRLAYALNAKNLKVSVINPLVIKNYARMLMKRTKSDKADCALLREFCETMDTEIWDPTPEWKVSAQQVLCIINGTEKHKTALTNKLKAFERSAYQSKMAIKELKKEIEHQAAIIERCWEELGRLVMENYSEDIKRLCTISGISKKTAIVLIVFTGGFENFASCKALCSYFGLCPRIFGYGTSVKGKGKICKMGMSGVRRQLYMCALSAMKHNKQCCELAERLAAAGKEHKKIRVAVANKLLRQAWAVCTFKREYDSAA